MSWCSILGVCITRPICRSSKIPHSISDFWALFSHVKHCCLATQYQSFFFFFWMCVSTWMLSLTWLFFFIDDYSDSDSDWDHLDLLQLTRVTVNKLLQELQQSTSTVLQRYFFYCLNRILVTLIAVFFCVVLKCRMREQIFFFSFPQKMKIQLLLYSFPVYLSRYVLFHTWKFWDNMSYDTEINIKLWSLLEQIWNNDYLGSGRALVLFHRH